MVSLVGILNITPDSFSDGGLNESPEQSLFNAQKLIKDGASVIDVGAESTRPGAKRISPEEEWKRLHPVLEILKTSEINAWISVDTRNYETAQKALLSGVDWINDVSGINNQKMLETLADNAANIVLMHNMGVPADPDNIVPEKENIVEYTLEWSWNNLKKLRKYGITEERVIFDPGIGFGKNPLQSYDIIKNIAKYRSLQTRIMVGHSRKSFLTMFTDKPAKDRDEPTCSFSHYLANKGVDYLRVHNISANKLAIESDSPPNLPEPIK